MSRQYNGLNPLKEFFGKIDEIIENEQEIIIFYID